MIKKNDQMKNCDSVFSCLKKRDVTRYTNMSQIMMIKGGYEIEIINDVENNLKASGTTEDAIHELRVLTQRAFNKSLNDLDHYVPRDIMVKNGIKVDWLVVVRKGATPIAFGSGTYITPFIFYLNGAMVDQNYQSTGIGLIANSVLWKTVFEESKSLGIGEIDFVCRTRNKNVASVFFHVMNDFHISSETIDTSKVNVFKKTASWTGSQYDAVSGISKDVYPERLPSGTKTKNQRVQKEFSKLGGKDALYICGNIKISFLDSLLARYIGSRIDFFGKKWDYAECA